MAGEIDIATVAQFEEQLLALAATDRPLVADLGQVSFIDAAGLRALGRAAKQAAAHRGRLHVVCGRPQILRLFHLTGLDDRVSLARTLADASSPSTTTPARPLGPITGVTHATLHGFPSDLKLPAEAIAQIAEDTRNGTADEFGVRQVELYHNAEGQVYCLLDGPDEESIRRHHAALGVPCGDVHQVDSLT